MNASPLTVLVVDDSPEDRLILRRLLARTDLGGYTLTEADRGDRALAAVRRTPPDCVLLDQRLPDQDGLMVLAALRAFTDVPVVLFTGVGNEALAVQALQQGAQDYLVKGTLTPERLHLTIQRAIASVRLTRERDQSQALLNAVVANAPSGIGFLDHTLRYQLVNPALATINNKTPAEHLGRTLVEMLPDLGPRVEPLVRQVLATGEAVYNLELHGQPCPHDGVTHDWLINYFPVRGPAGAALGIGVTVTDITASKRAEESLRCLQTVTASLAATQTLAEVGRVILDEVTQALGAVAISLRLVDGDRLILVDLIQSISIDSETVRRYRSVPLSDSHPATDVARTGCARFHHNLADIAQGYPHLAEAARAVPAQANAHLPLTCGNAVFGVLSMHFAATRRWDEHERAFAQAVADQVAVAYERARLYESERDARRRLEETTAQLEAVLDHLPVGLAILDRDLHFVRVNPRMAALNGRGAAQHLGHKMIALGRSDPAAQTALAAVESLMRQVLVSGQGIYGRELTMPAGSDPSVLQHLLASWFPVTIDGAVQLVGAAVLDITDRVRAEQALRQSEARFRTLADAVPQIIWANDSDGNAIYFNQRWYDYSGRTEAQSLGRGWQVIAHPDDIRTARGRWRRALAAGAVFETQYRLRRADGVYRWFIGRNVPLHDEAGAISGWFGSATDIEDLKQVEATRHERDVLRRLAEAQEEERLRIARDLHDQLGQQITGLLLRLKQLEAPAQGTAVAALLPPVQALAIDLAKEAHRIAVNLRPTALEDVGLVAALERLIADWSRQAGTTVAFERLGLDQGRLPRSVEVALFRVVQEALTNVQKHAVAANVGVIIERRGDQVSVVIEDNGCGFALDAPPDDEGLPRLGLLGMRERVAHVGGMLEIESSPAIGTTIFVRVPL